MHGNLIFNAVIEGKGEIFQWQCVNSCKENGLIDEIAKVVKKPHNTYLEKPSLRTIWGLNVNHIPNLK